MNFLKKIYHCALLYLYANWLTPGESNLFSIVGPYESTPPLVVYLSLSLPRDTPSSASSDSSHGLVLSPFRTFVFQMKWNVNRTSQSREPNNDMIGSLLHPCFITGTYMLLSAVTILMLKNLRLRETPIPCSILNMVMLLWLHHQTILHSTVTDIQISETLDYFPGLTPPTCDN
jgi:hypothetical protein